MKIEYWGDVQPGQRAIVVGYFEDKPVKRIEPRPVHGGLANGIVSEASHAGYYVSVPDSCAATIIEEENE